MFGMYHSLVQQVVLIRQHSCVQATVCLFTPYNSSQGMTVQVHDSASLRGWGPRVSIPFWVYINLTVNAVIAQQKMTAPESQSTRKIYPVFIDFQSGFLCTARLYLQSDLRFSMGMSHNMIQTEETLHVLQKPPYQQRDQRDSIQKIKDMQLCSFFFTYINCHAKLFLFSSSVVKFRKKDVCYVAAFNVCIKMTG